MKNQKFKKVVSVFLSVLMLISCMMCVASAEEGETVIDPATCPHIKFETEKVEATCNSQSYVIYTCDVCGYGYKGDFGPSLDHEFGDWQLNGENCTQIRTKTRYCTTPGCLAQETEYAYDKNGEPIYGDHTVVLVPGKAATCVKDGYSDYTLCLICNKLSESEPLAATGHADNDLDGNCDKCRSVMNPEGHCSCFCHGESSLEQFAFKIFNFFWKLFKINDTCECGATKHW